MKKLTCLILALAVLFSVSATVFAASSPQGGKKYNVTITSDSNDEITTQIIDGGDTLTLNATEEDGYTFIEWIITGDYEIVSGDLDSSVLVIKPLGDITVHESGEYAEDEDKPSKEDPKEDEEEKEEGEKNESDTAPETGHNIFLLLSGIILASSALILVSRKRAF